ncbi:MAG: retropepsin-like aspartic protease [Ardenticatenaceae bacterium]
MIDYDKSQDPPAPMLQVTVSKARYRRPRRTVPALVDTGADITAVPHHLLNSLQLDPIGRVQIEGVRAKSAIVYTYGVRLKLADIVIKRIEVILADFDFVVLGRDVLNRLYLLLNGPELTFDLSEAPFVLKE